MRVVSVSSRWAMPTSSGTGRRLIMTVAHAWHVETGRWRRLDEPSDPQRGSVDLVNGTCRRSYCSHATLAHERIEVEDVATATLRFAMVHWALSKLPPPHFRAR